MYRTRLEARWIVMVLILSLFPVLANAQSFFSGEASPDLSLVEQGEKDSKRHRYMRVEDQELEEIVVFDLFEDVQLTAERLTNATNAEAEVWIGRLANDSNSSVILSKHSDGTWFGKISTQDTQFQIRYRGGSSYAVVEVDTSNMDEEEDENPKGDNESSSASSSFQASHPSVCDPSATCPNQTMTVMVLYTESAMLGLGGSQSAAEAAIGAAVAELNMATSNSQVNHSFELIHTDLIDYVESGSIRTDRNRLQDPTDGYMDRVHEGRSLFGADIVSVIVGSGGCGIAFIQEDPTFMDPQKGFNITEFSCMTGNLTFTHEIGHNIGLRHDRFADPNITPCEAHHGYVNQEALLPNSPASSRWRTIMAYNNQCSSQGISCPRLPFWSNPEVTFNGDPMGLPLTDANPTFSAYGLNRTSCVVSQFADPNPNDMIWVVSDYSSAPWATGETRDLVWRSNFSELVDIELLRDGDSVFIVEEDYNNDEFYQLSIPSFLDASCSYQVQIKKSSNSSLVGTSPNFCYSDYVELIEPDSQTLFNFDELTIKAQKSFDEAVNIKLYKNGQEWQTIESEWSFNVLGTYTWVSDIDNFELGCDYKIRIEKFDAPESYDESEGDLCFNQRDLVVAHPLYDANWESGTQILYQWESIYDSNIDIFARQIDGSWTITIAEDIPNTGQHLLVLADWVKSACNYKIVIRVRDTGQEVESRGTVCLDSNNSFSVRAKGLLGGAMLADGSMRQDLNSQDILPRAQPYEDIFGFSVDDAPFGENVVDWVWIELRTGIGPETAVAKAPFFIESTNGIAAPYQLATFYGVPNGDYYAVLGHRNHLPVMTASPVSMGFGMLPLVDFRSNLYSQNGGAPAMTLEDGKLALWPGDVLSDGRVSYSGSNNDRVEILNQAGGPTPFDFVNGYLQGDINLDGKVAYSGSQNDRVIVLETSGGPTPFTVRESQVPGY